jgi:hypothetical protein
LSAPLDITQPLTVGYCIPTWLRDLQIQSALARPIARLQYDATRFQDGPIAVVGYGPSLADTWSDLRDYAAILTCSGAHRFLLERGIVPTWHLDVDPRPHKVDLLGPPSPATTYLLASACHPRLFDHLADARVELWHVFDPTESGLRLLPPGEWAVTGGANAGLRALAMARMLGYRDLHVFGMDGCEGPTGKHAGAHPNQAPGAQAVTYCAEPGCPDAGTVYQTTAAFMDCARQTLHELTQLVDVTATFHGEGLVQHLARHWVRAPAKGIAMLCTSKPPVISPEYRALNATLHAENLYFGVGGARHADMVAKLAAELKTTTVLDYGCGKGLLAQALPFPIWEYDPAVPGKDTPPRPADLVVATDVLEHIEPEHLEGVLCDLVRCIRHIGFLTINTQPATKTLPDGRNTHLIVQPKAWWKARLEAHFSVARIFERGPELFVLVAPRGTPSLEAGTSA